MTLLLVSSGGGHLKQLVSLLPRMNFPTEERLWVTFDTGLSRSLLSDEEVVYARYAAPRDTANIARNAGLAARILGSRRFGSRRFGSRRFDYAVSTGSSLAANFLPLARLRGTSCHFIETAARATGPSMTGKIMQRVPGIHTYTQYPFWAGGRWKFAGSVFDDYTPGPVAEPATDVRSAVVTLGTTESYGFRRMIEALVPLLDGADVLWQTGSTDVSGLGIESRESVPHGELTEAVGKADVVVAHAGTGAAITALDHGKCPILVPRRERFGEHVDDHQVQIAAELHRRGLALAGPVEDLSPALLRAAASRSTVSSENPAPLNLDV
jgi:UDP-N-acetylglucosamine--N-acetylmuramyl-(pentapeptide) pyrophosphoryl-undecaprenol N-acetylglucosamine transferase